MGTEIRIRFDGSTPGLEDGRLSLGEFLPALNALLKALRRIGSNIVVQASNDADRGRKGGRLAKEAADLDLEISRIDHNCLVISTAATAHPRCGDDLRLFNDLPEFAGEELFKAIEFESQGRQRNQLVRKYLRALPPGVTQQRYWLTVDGVERSSVTVGAMPAVKDTETLPGLREFVARPTGVVFAQNAPQIQLTELNGNVRWHSATTSQVNQVLANRDASVRVLTIFGTTDRPRILRLSVGDAPLTKPSVEVRHRRIFTDWSGVLRRLA